MFENHSQRSNNGCKTRVVINKHAKKNELVCNDVI